MMSSFQIIIDGYNLLHAAGFARRRYGPGGLHKARQQLLRFLLHHLSTAERDQTIIVFDARDRPFEASDHAGVLEGMRILFASPHGDADVIVEELIAQHSAPRRLTVVSSDHRLQTAARHRRALYLDSESFVEDLLRRPPPAPQQPVQPHPKQTGEVPAAEVEFWLREFAGVLEDVKSSEKKRRKEQKPPEQPASQPQPSVPPASAVKSKHAPGEGDRRGPKADTESPAIFSDAWLADLQQWVDDLQKRRR